MITHKRGHQGTQNYFYCNNIELYLGITFPKILVCSHSMHSKGRLQKNYPRPDCKKGELFSIVLIFSPTLFPISIFRVNDTYLRMFYGSFAHINGLSKDYWSEIVSSLGIGSGPIQIPSDGDKTLPSGRIQTLNSGKFQGDDAKQETRR